MLQQLQGPPLLQVSGPWRRLAPGMRAWLLVLPSGHTFRTRAGAASFLVENSCTLAVGVAAVLGGWRLILFFAFGEEEGNGAGSGWKLRRKNQKIRWLAPPVVPASTGQELVYTSVLSEFSSDFGLWQNLGKKTTAQRSLHTVPPRNPQP